MTEKIYARRDKSRRRVLCGGPGNNHRCSFQIGEIAGHPGAEYVVLGMHWYESMPEVWQLFEHARKRVKLGLPPRTRAPRYKSFFRGEDGVLRSKTSAGARSLERMEDTGVAPVLPIYAVCGRCGCRNYLDPELLAVRGSTI